MKEQDRQRIIRQKLVRMERAGARTGEPLSTGFAVLDQAMGIGGLPRGNIVEIFGPASSGKSTLAQMIVAHNMDGGASAAWLDAEHVFDPAQAARLGIPVERLVLARPDSAEQALEIARRLVESAALDLLVIDSAAALVPQLERATGIGESSQGLHTRVLAWGLRRLSAAAAKAGAVVLVLNQSRGRADEGETSAGGPPLKLYASVRIVLDAAGAHQVRFRILKNKSGEAYAEGTLRWKSGWMLTESP
jgi:recombination protein RecA